MAKKKKNRTGIAFQPLLGSIMFSDVESASFWQSNKCLHHKTSRHKLYESAP